MFQRLCRHYHLRPSGVIYDVTNTYLYGRRCPLAKPGHDKEGVTGRPLIQIGLAVTQKEGLPLFHKVFDGNVHDSRTLRDLSTQFGDYRLGTGLFIDDRGSLSKRNVKDIQDLHWDTLCGVPLNPALKKFWRPWANPQLLMQFPNRVRVASSVFYTLLRPFRIDRIRGNLALCFNEQRQRDTRESRRDEIVYAQKLLAEGKAIQPGLQPFFDGPGSLTSGQVGGRGRVRRLLLYLLHPFAAGRGNAFSVFRQGLDRKSLSQSQRHYPVASPPPLARRTRACPRLPLLSRLPTSLSASLSSARYRFHRREGSERPQHHVQGLSPRCATPIPALAHSDPNPESRTHLESDRQVASEGLA